MIFDPELVDDEAMMVQRYMWKCFQCLIDETDIDPEKAAQAFFAAGLIRFADFRGAKGSEEVQEFYNGLVERAETSKTNLN